MEKNRFHIFFFNGREYIDQKLPEESDKNGPDTLQQFFFSVGEGIKHWHHFIVENAQKQKFLSISHKISKANYTKVYSRIDP